jgi:hypothetical protein
MNTCPRSTSQMLLFNLQTRGNSEQTSIATTTAFNRCVYQEFIVYSGTARHISQAYSVSLAVIRHMCQKFSVSDGYPSHLLYLYKSKLAPVNSSARAATNRSAGGLLELVLRPNLSILAPGNSVHLRRRVTNLQQTAGILHSTKAHYFTS